MAIVRQAEKAPEIKIEEDTKEKAKPVKTAKKKAVAETEKTLKELRLELQKLSLEIKIGKESNTSLLRKLRKEIARKLTKENMIEHNHNH